MRSRRPPNFALRRDKGGDAGRARRHRSRRRRREPGRGYFEGPECAEDRKEDPREQRSLALVVLFAVILVLAVCFSIIAKNLEVENPLPF